LAVNLEDNEAVIALAERLEVDLTVVGPEAPLGRGLADAFRARGLAILGPSRRGADLECSKVYSKHFMLRHGIPTARFIVCRHADEALGAIRGEEFGFPVVLKADGLAAGKGVVIAQDLAEAEQAIQAAMVDRQFGASGDTLVIEECLSGPEVSAFFLCDGEIALSLSTAEDHKRIFDGDRGPNTGGMGAFAPSPRATEDIVAFTRTRVVEPVLAGMRAIGEPYRGFLYVSLMLTADGPKVIEFNVRFGDPEAQVVLPLLDGPFGRACLDAARGGLEPGLSLVTGADRYVGVVLASRGYPESAQSGMAITGLEHAAAIDGALIFHAGTRLEDDVVQTAGGRVLTVVGRGASYEAAMAVAYQATGMIHFDGMQLRHDIGRKAISTAVQVQR
jgi:phosphoribosylamine--glycine ligase